MRVWTKSEFPTKDINLLFVFLFVLAISIVSWSRINVAASIDYPPQPIMKARVSYEPYLSLVEKKTIPIPEQITNSSTQSEKNDTESSSASLTPSPSATSQSVPELQSQQSRDANLLVGLNDVISRVGLLGNLLLH